MSQELLIKWYIDEYQPFSDYEEFVLKSPENKFKRLSFNIPYDSHTFNKYFDLLPHSNITSNTHRLEVLDCGSDFIRALFKRYADDDTFVLSSTCEHDTTRECLGNVEHKLELYMDIIRKMNIDDIMTEFKKSGCSKFMLYMVGTSISSGEIVPQEFFEKLKKELEDREIPHVLILDDVHGMFITPRDYTIFDYIIYTAHSLVCDYNMGMMISKIENEPIGMYDWMGLDEYYTRLSIILQRKDKLRLFKQVLTQYFADLLVDDEFFDLFKFTSQHIFSLKTYKIKFTDRQREKLKEYKIRLGDGNWYQNFARIRFQEFIRQDYTKMIEGLTYLRNVLEVGREIYKESEFNG